MPKDPLVRATSFPCHCPISELFFIHMEREELVQKAVKAATYAYAPYSNFPVGAAVLTTCGKVFSGCNVENASYGLSLCAERVALTKAISDGYKEFETLAVSVPKGGSPCGACRQFILEFGTAIKIVLADENGLILNEYESKDLLPDAFGPHSLS